MNSGQEQNTTRPKGVGQRIKPEWVGIPPRPSSKGSKILPTATRWTSVPGYDSREIVDDDTRS